MGLSSRPAAAGERGPCLHYQDASPTRPCACHAAGSQGTVPYDPAGAPWMPTAHLQGDRAMPHSSQPMKHSEERASYSHPTPNVSPRSWPGSPLCSSPCPLRAQSHMHLEAAQSTEYLHHPFLQITTANRCRCPGQRPAKTTLLKTS